MTRVLHVHSGNLYGGVETVLVTLARHAALAPDTTWRFALTTAGRLSNELTVAGAAPFVVGIARASRPWTVLAARAQLGQLLRREPCHAAMVHSLWTLAVFGPVLRAAGLPVVLWVHGVADSPGWLEWWASRTRPDLVIANSAFTASRLPPLLAGVPVAVVHPPFTPRAASAASRPELRRALGAADADVVLLLVARIERGKGHALLLESLAAVSAEAPWRCWIAGGAQRAEEEVLLTELQSQAQRHTLGARITFLGERDDVPALLAAADVFVQPNTVPEGFGLALVEALAAGKPVVATRIGATPEITGDDGALLVPPEAAPLTQAISHLLEHPDTRARLGAAGPARARAAADPAAVIPALAALLATHPALRRSTS